MDLSLREKLRDWGKGVARALRAPLRFFKRHFLTLFGGVFVAFIFAGWVWFGLHHAPTLFPVRTVVTIPEGTSLRGVADMLEEKRVVRNRKAFVLLAHMKGVQAEIKAGDYYFETPLSMSEVLVRLARGEYGLEPVRVTVPEGATTYQMATLFGKVLEKFDPTTFMLLTRDKEGYLFPDTYFFLPNAKTVDVLHTLETTFYERLRLLEGRIAQFGRPVHEVVTMASLLEKEARDHEERRTIAGILWNRLEIEMPLQVDAVFGFIERTDTFSPRFSHLAIDSPYNTYKYRGLPPGPIGSPSLKAIEAAISPNDTDALFYLHGRDGVMRVARTYDEHLQNRRRYLD